MVGDVQIGNRVDVHGDGMGDGAKPRRLGRVFRQQSRVWKARLQIFDDCQRLSHHLPVDGQRRHIADGASLAMRGGAMLALQQIDHDPAIIQTLEVQRDPHSIACR